MTNLVGSVFKTPGDSSKDTWMVVGSACLFSKDRCANPVTMFPYFCTSMNDIVPSIPVPR